MQRPVLIAVLIVVALAAGAIVWAMGGFGAPPLPGPPVPEAPPSVVEAAAARAEAEAPRQTDTPNRHLAAGATVVALEDDPEIRAALTGFRGRVVDAKHVPVAASGVRIYRGAMDSILPEGVDPMAETSSWQPDYVAGETKTDGDGKFLIGGVWPRGFYLLFAGIGSDAPSHRIVQRTPAPGEVVDLGDIVLDACGVLTGTVVDENGHPVAGAMVRAVDLPGQALATVPLERFDPKGCIMVRQAEAPASVMEMPTWVEAAFERLPVPTTRSGDDGTFRLTGVMPGNNYVATIKSGLLADVKATVKVTAGETKDLGTIQLREGEILSGRVVDPSGKPIAGAEIVAGTTSLVIPVDFAHHIGTSDDKGQFEATGFGAGKVTVAARRSARDPWVMLAPQPIAGDVVVTLPGVANLTIRVMQNGQPVHAPKLKLMPAKASEEALVFAAVGFVQPIALQGRIEQREDGSTVVSDLPTAHYVVLAAAEGTAVATADADLSKGAAQVSIDLQPSNAFAVRVLGPEDKPIRNAAIYAQDRGRNRGAMPLCCGRTDADGKLLVESIASDQVRVSAEHPRWGAVHGEHKTGEGELVLRMQEPGWIEGTLTDRGKPPELGKYSVGAEWQHGDGPRGATESVPMMCVPGPEGAFALRGLQPGHYDLAAMPALDSLHSPGGFFEMVQRMPGEDFGHAAVDVLSGAGAVARLEVSGGAFEGPSGSLAGSVQIDGRLAADSTMQIWAEGHQFRGVVDAAGRYNFDRLPAGDLHVTLQRSGGIFAGGSLWSQSLKLAEGEHRELNIVVATSSLRGQVLMPDGTPAASMNVQASVSVKGADKDGDGGAWMHVRTDADGRFAIEQAVAGTYRLEVQGDEERHARGSLGDLVLEPGRPLDNIVMRLRATVELRGTIDLTGVAAQPEWMWMSIRTLDKEHPDNAFAGDQVEGMGVDKDGAFASHGLDPGDYHVMVHCNIGDKWETLVVPGTVTVPPGGATGVVLRPQKQQ